MLENLKPVFHEANLLARSHYHVSKSNTDKEKKAREQIRLVENGLKCRRAKQSPSAHQKAVKGSKVARYILNVILRGRL